MGVTIRAAVTAALATAGLASRSSSGPADRTLALDAWFLAVGALALLAVLHSTVGRLPVEPRHAARPPAKPAVSDAAPRPGRARGAVALGAESAFDLYYRLRPALRRIAASRLRARGIDLDGPGGHAAARARTRGVGRSSAPTGRARRQPRSRRRSFREIAATVEALERL